MNMLIFVFVKSFCVAYRFAIYFSLNLLHLSDSRFYCFCGIEFEFFFLRVINLNKILEDL